MPYAKAKNWADTQADIGKLLRKHGIGDVQWSLSDQQRKMALSFVKIIKGKRHYDSMIKDYVEDVPDTNVVVRMTVPLKPEGQERNISFRVLFWYLKSKLEAIAFSFTDGTEMFKFEREFFGNVVIEDQRGRSAEAYDAFKAGDVELAAPDRVIALPGSKAS